jgi:hypothetical protein
MFDLGWPYLGEVLHNTVNSAIESSQRVLLLITYHFSKSDTMRGCAGFDHDREKREHPDMQKLMIKKSAVLDWNTRNLLL